MLRLIRVYTNTSMGSKIDLLEINDNCGKQLKYPKYSEQSGKGMVLRKLCTFDGYSVVSYKGDNL